MSVSLVVESKQQNAVQLTRQIHVNCKETATALYKEKIKHEPY